MTYQHFRARGVSFEGLASCLTGRDSITGTGLPRTRRERAASLKRAQAHAITKRQNSSRLFERVRLGRSRFVQALLCLGLIYSSLFSVGPAQAECGSLPSSASAQADVQAPTPPKPARVSGSGSQAKSLAQSSEQMQAEVERVMPLVEELRGLKFEQAVPAKVVSDAESREHVLGRLDEFDAREQLANSAEIYRLLGLIPSELDLEAAFLDAIEEQAGGFYDPATKSFYLLDDVPEALIETLMVHELVHALEDQHYDLDARLRDAMENEDRAFAVSALHEGSATLVMFIHTAKMVMRGEATAEQLEASSAAMPQDVLETLPPVMVRQLLGPYLLGVSFLQRGNMFGFMNGFPHEDVARAFKEGPTSSEQILHPEKYWDADSFDAPTDVPLLDLAPLLGADWSRLADGTLGELSLAAVVDPSPLPGAEQLAVSGAAPWTHPAAAGWDGDRWQLWGAGEQRIALLETVWDSDQDASEFLTALEPRSEFELFRKGQRVWVGAGDGAIRWNKVWKRAKKSIAARGDVKVSP